MATTSADSPAEDSPPLRDQNGEQQEGKAEEESQGPSAAQPEEPPSENEVVKMEAVTPDVGQEAEEADEKPSVEIVAAEALAAQDRAKGTESGGGIAQFAGEDGRPKQASPRGCCDSGDGTVKEVKQEQRDENEPPMNNCIEGKACDDAMEKNNGDSELENKRRASVEISSSDGEPLSRMDSEDSISSTLMDMDSTVSSGRSTPAMMNGLGSAALSSNKSVAYTCCWDQCLACFSSSPDLAEHIRTLHVDGQRGGVFVCLWKGCKVYNTPSTSQSWLQRHMLTHSGDKPFKCVVGGCYASFASQGGLARHVPTHFSQQSSSKLSNQARLKEDSPSKAGLSKRRKLRNKRRRSLPRPHDFFDAQTMDTIRHRAICLNMATHIESRGGGHSVVFHSTVMARRKEDSGKVKVLLHWTPEDILPDVWVNETDRVQLKTKAVHLSQLPTDTAILLDPNIYRTLPQKRMKRR